MSILSVEGLRGGIPESSHRVCAAVTDAAGRLIAHAGDPDLRTFMRSAAKPFQALPVIEDGAADRYGFSSEELALACASHNSERRQVELVRGLLARIGCEESQLACGPHRPLRFDLALPPDGTAPREEEMPRTPVTSNCSGKHTAMLALARHHGWPVESYERPEHQVQQRCRETVAQWTGLDAREIGEAVDGCGVVSFAVPLRAMAVAYARLAQSSDAAPRRVVAAMTGHPELVAGVGRPCTALMQAYPRTLLTKVGAEGVYGAALLDRGVGIALKVVDGHTWAAVVALFAILGTLGITPPPADLLPQFAAPAIRNTCGAVVGRLESRGGALLD